MSQFRSKAVKSLVHWDGKDSSVHEWNMRPKALVVTASYGRVFYGTRRSFRLAETPGGLSSNPLGKTLRPDQVAGLCLDRSEEPPRMEAAQPLQTTCPTSYCPHREKVFPCTQSRTPPVSTYACCLSSSHHMVLSRAWLHLLHDLPVRTRRLLCGPPEALSPSGWTNPGPTSSPWWVCAHLVAYHPCRAFPTELPSQAVPAWISAGELPSWGQCFAFFLVEFQKVPASPVPPDCLRSLWVAALTSSILAGPEITKQVRLEETSGDHLIQSPCSKTDQLQQVTQDCVLLGFYYLWGWRLYSLLGDLFQCLIILTVKNLFLMFKQNFLCFNLWPLHLILSLDTTKNGPAQSSVLPPISYLYTLIKGLWIFNWNQ